MGALSIILDELGSVRHFRRVAAGAYFVTLGLLPLAAHAVLAAPSTVVLAVEGMT
jgi:hypothetical protein